MSIGYGSRDGWRIGWIIELMNELIYYKKNVKERILSDE